MRYDRASSSTSRVNPIVQRLISPGTQAERVRQFERRRGLQRLPVGHEHQRKVLNADLR